MSISNPSAGVISIEPPADLTLSIISSKKCAEPVTFKFFTDMSFITALSPLIPLDSIIPLFEIESLVILLTFAVVADSVVVVVVVADKVSAFAVVADKVSVVAVVADSVVVVAVVADKVSAFAVVADRLLKLPVSPLTVFFAYTLPFVVISPSTSFVPSKACPQSKCGSNSVLTVVVKPPPLLPPPLYCPLLFVLEKLSILIIIL